MNIINIASDENKPKRCGNCVHYSTTGYGHTGVGICVAPLPICVVHMLMLEGIANTTLENYDAADCPLYKERD